MSAPFIFNDESYATVPASLSYAFMRLARAARTIDSGVDGPARNQAVMDLMSIQLETLERVLAPGELARLEPALNEASFNDIQEAINAFVAGGAAQGKGDSGPSSQSRKQTKKS